MADKFQGVASHHVTSSATLIARARRFRFYAEHLWRFHRPFVRRYLRQRCAICVVSEAYSPLENGICAECRTSVSTPSGATTDQETHLLAAELDPLLTKSQGAGAGA